MSKPHLFISLPLFLLWEDLVSLFTLASFSLARTVVADFRSCFLFLRTRLFIFLADGILKALFQLVLHRLETIYTQVLSIDWSAKKQEWEQDERKLDVHDRTSHD